MARVRYSVRPPPPTARDTGRVKWDLDEGWITRDRAETVYGLAVDGAGEIDAAVVARALTDALLRSTGPVEWVEDENLMDAVTAVSGSGPAYVFLLAETLARAGEKAGLPKELAAKLARETVSGAGELLYRSDLPASKLRENVTSPNGTTAAALKILMGEAGIDKLFEEAVAAATKRGKELAG